MTRDFTEKLRFEEGFFPNQNLVGDSRYKNGLMVGSRNVWLEGLDKIRSWDGPLAFGSFGNKIMRIVGSAIGTLASGSVIRFRDGMTWVVGSGTVRLGSSGTGTAFTGTAQDYLQFVSGFGTLTRAGVPRILTPPTLKIAARDGNPMNTTGTNIINATNFPGLARNNGEVSIKVSSIAFGTQSEGNASPPSASVSFTDQAAQIILPASSIPSRLSGYRIYSTRRRFGKFGPWFFLVEIPAFIDQQSLINASNVIKNANNPMGLEPNTITTGGFFYTWSDGDLKSVFAPFDQDAPDSGATHVFSLGDVMVLVYPAGRLLVSAPGLAEAYPPQFETFLDPQEDALTVCGRPGAGWQYIACRNSLHTVILSEDNVRPLDVQARWPECGIANPNAYCFVHDTLYALSADKGFVRTNGGPLGQNGPDSSYGLRVESEITRLGLDPDTCVMGYHQDEDCVVFFFSDRNGDQVALVYKVKLDKWCSPFYVRDAGVGPMEKVTGAVTLNGTLVFSTDAPSGTNMYAFTGGQSGTIPWKAIVFWREATGYEGYPHTIDGYTFSYDIGMGKTIRARLKTNFDLANTTFDPGPFTGRANAQYSAWAKISEHQSALKEEIKVFTLEFEGAGGNQQVMNGIVTGGVSSIRV